MVMRVVAKKKFWLTALLNCIHKAKNRQIHAVSREDTFNSVSNEISGH